MSEVRQIKCGVHGWKAESVVCKHIVESLHTGQSVGFNWPAEATEPHPDAWCSSCEEARAAGSGEWTPEIEAMLDIQLFCGACYERAKEIWRKGYKEVQ